MRLANALARYRHVLLATTVVSAIAVPQIVSAFDQSGAGRIIVAQKEDPKKKQQQQQQQQQPKPQPQKAPPPPPPPPKQVQPQAQPKIQQQQQQQKQVQPQIQQQQKQVQPQIQQQQQQQQKILQQQQQQKFQQQKQVQPKGEPKLQPKQVQPGQPQLQPQPKQVQPVQPSLQPQPKQQVVPSQPQLQPQPKQVQPLQKQPPVEIQKFGQPKTLPPDGRVGNVNELKGKRQEERQGNAVIIREPGNRTIIRENKTLIIRHDEGERMRRWGNARFETRGNERFTIVNRGGYDVVTITDARGHMLRRYRRFPDGREYALIDNRRRFGVGAAAVVGGAVLLGLAMPMITIPRERYIVDMGTAPPGYLYDALDAPPLVPMERAYTLDEVRDNYELRARVPSVDVNTINFATGSWEITPDQIPRLQGLAEAMLRVISENPSTVFMLEGHTDAVGSDEDNLSLSDRRAEAVAEVLTTHFNIPPENLVTQGYGEQHLRVQTAGPARENRRVEVRNVTGLMAGQGGPEGPPQGQPPG